MTAPNTLPERLRQIRAFYTASSIQGATLAEAADALEEARERLKFAIENLEGIRDETDIPSSVIIAKGRAFLSRMETK